MLALFFWAVYFSTTQANTAADGHALVISIESSKVNIDSDIIRYFFANDLVLK